MKFQWNLSPLETLGVTVVGVGMAFAASKVANMQTTSTAHQVAMVGLPTAIYVAGVIIGTNRPVAGWIEQKS